MTPSSPVSFGTNVAPWVTRLAAGWAGSHCGDAMMRKLLYEDAQTIVERSAIS